MATLSTVINLVNMAASLWLGFYLVTRSARSRVSWLAALTLWSLAAIFLHNVLAINVPESGILPLARLIALLALPFWFNLTWLLLPEKAQWLPASASRLGVLLAFGMALILSDPDTGPRYPHSIGYIVVLVLCSLFNLWQAQKQTRSHLLKSQFAHLIVATILATLGALYINFSTWLDLRGNLFNLPGDVALGAGVILLGYATARYNALVQVRAIERDFLYSTLVVSLITIFYYLAALMLYYGGHISVLSLILIVVVAISSHALYDGVRVALDRIFYQEQFRQLRANLRALAQETGTGQTLSTQLTAILTSLCQAWRVQNGFIALRQAEDFALSSAYGIEMSEKRWPWELLLADEIALLEPKLDGMALLVPLYTGSAQVGALLLSTKEGGGPYSEEDLELLDDLADQIATVIHTWRLQQDNAQTINEMVADFRQRERALRQQVEQLLAERQFGGRPVLTGVDEKAFVSLVEDALRRMHDYPYLGEHALAELQIVRWRLQRAPEPFITHLERGKALHEVLLQALHKLRPPGEEPDAHQPPERKWHQFIILHDSYVLGKLHRDTMSRLYVSEATFHRVRRRAVRAAARALQEMEREVQRQEA